MEAVRASLQAAPLNQFAWATQWKAGDPGFLAFVGDNALPRSNPLQFIPGFEQADPIVQGFTASGDIAALERGLQALVAGGMNEAQLKGALVATLFHRVNLIRVIGGYAGESLRRIQSLREWLNTSNFIGGFCTPQERAILRFFAGGMDPAAAAADAAHPLSQNLELSDESSAERILRAQLTAHFVAAVMSAPADSELHIFATLMTSPNRLDGTYLPAMPQVRDLAPMLA